MSLSLFSTLLLLGTILSQAINRLLTKHALKVVDPLALVIYANVLTGLCLLPLAVIRFEGLPQLSPLLIVLYMVSVVAWALFGYIYNLALKVTPVSTFTVITQLQVVLITLLGLTILKQPFSFGLIIGVLLICSASILVTYTKGARQELTKKGVLLSVLTSICGASAIFIDSILIKHFEPFFYGTTIIIFSTLPLLFLYRFKKEDLSLEKTRLYVIVGTFFAISFMMPLLLYRQDDVLISFVYPILRTGAIISVVLGIIIFKEKTNWAYKIVAILLASIGAICIKFY